MVECMVSFQNRKSDVEWIIFPNYVKLNLKSFVNQHSLPCKTKENNQHGFCLVQISSTTSA